MRVRRAQHDGVHQIVEDEIVEIAPLAGQKAPVLAPLRRRPDAGTDLHYSIVTPAKAGAQGSC